MVIPSAEIKSFRTRIYHYYKSHARRLPWRSTHNSYRIFVSEIMLQQTQVDRVIEKYKEFIKRFPDFKALAAASQAEVLKAWQGLGYNRRALHLHQAAKDVVEKFEGKLPKKVEELTQLPGIGKNTAAAICAYAFNMPVVYIETNIRAVFIHFFFADKKDVTDEQLLPLVEQAVDKKNPHKWYSALMDYGVMLKKKYKNPARRSAHHVKQSRFEGSNRQLRGKIVRALLAKSAYLKEELAEYVASDSQKLDDVVAGLQKEGFLRIEGKKIKLR